MPFLYEKIETLRDVGMIQEVPPYISENLNPAFELRPYQVKAFENFITYFENDRLCLKPTQTLFHMATGSGKTLIMAGLILYLYKKGYRNFYFFVHLSNIVQKTKENFLNSLSSKYLFNSEIVIDGERIPIKEVNSFQNTDENAINICFGTIQGLHSDLYLVKENNITMDDFANDKVVLISDEAHHLNATTKFLDKKNNNDDVTISWETSVKSIVNANKDNVLLEFTATCDLANRNIKAEYENKIIFDYPLYKFRNEGFSKEIKTLRADISMSDRMIQAIVLSQCRLKIFQDNRLSVKPVVLFKSAKIDDSKKNMQFFLDIVSNLTAEELKRISELTENETLHSVWNYFVRNNISFQQLAQELREDFSKEHCISANDESEASKQQIILNSLEDASNPYRAVFEVKKLDEGWDVLNLFDIVRLYETRQSGGKQISPATISEAQLIGRGARYCPFKVEETQEKFKRKYDEDLDNPLRICEELYYHCQIDSRYIGELNRALREIGLDLEKPKTVEYVLKQEFKEEDFYKQGLLFSNTRVVKDRKSVTSLLPSIREKVYTVKFFTGKTGEDLILDETVSTEETGVSTFTVRKTINEIAGINYAIVQRALCKYPVFKYNILENYFPNLKSTREFITNESYLGEVKIDLKTSKENPSPELWHKACIKVLGKIADEISAIQETYEGTKEFTAKNVKDVIKNKRCLYSEVHEGGIGYSQNDLSVKEENRLDLSKEDWFVFEDNFGTGEEKAFVAEFKNYVQKLKDKYDKVYLVRNERQVAIYSFDGGERFEPDYLLFLQLKNATGFEQMQIFIEPKGSHLMEKDKWKEDFLLKLEKEAIPVIKIKDDNKYKIWGFQFYNKEKRNAEFAKDMENLYER